MKNSSREIKQANISETDTRFRTSGCGSVCIRVAPRDHEVHKLATRSTFMDGGCISNKMDTPKSICFPSFCFYRQSVSQSNERQAYLDHNNTSVALPAMLHPVMRNVYTRTNFHSPISNLSTNRNQNQHPLCQDQTLVLAARKVSDNSILQKVYQAKQLIYLKVAKDQAHSINTKGGAKCRVFVVFQEKLIPFLLV